MNAAAFLNTEKILYLSASVSLIGPQLLIRPSAETLGLSKKVE